MKVFRLRFLILVAVLATGFSVVSAQEEAESPFSIGADLVNSYVWRGSQVHGASFQPYMSYTIGGLEIGAWGAYEIAPASAVYAEADLYASYGFDFGLSLGITDYYYPGGEGWFEVSDTAGTHAFELNAGYGIGGLSLSANYVLNEAAYAASVGGDLYFEVGYSFNNFDLFLGAGNGWHTTFEDNGDDIFTVCNIGISTSKELKVSESFSLPVFGSVSLNPDKKQFNIVAGISF